MTGSNGFDALEDEIQLFFISQMIKNASFESNEKYIKIYIKLSKTKLFYLKDLFSSRDFQNVLKKFRTTIQVTYPSEIFEKIKSIIIKDRKIYMLYFQSFTMIQQMPSEIMHSISVIFYKKMESLNL